MKGAASPQTFSSSFMPVARSHLESSQGCLLVLDKGVPVPLQLCNPLGSLSFPFVHWILFAPGFKQLPFLARENASPWIRLVHIQVNACNVAANFWPWLKGPVLYLDVTLPKGALLFGVVLHFSID